MAKEVIKDQKNSQVTSGARLMVRVEYVGIIAIACLVIGAVVGSGMSGGKGKIIVDTAERSQSGMSAAMPSEEEIKHVMEQIGATKNYSALVQMGNAAMDKGASTIAVAAYEKALTLNDKDPNVLTDLGAVYNDQLGDSKKALELFKRAAKLDPRHLQSRYNAAIASIHLNDIKGAKAFFEEVIKIDPDSAQARDAKKQLDHLKDKG